MSVCNPSKSVCDRLTVRRFLEFPVRQFCDVYVPRNTHVFRTERRSFFNRIHNRELLERVGMNGEFEPEFFCAGTSVIAAKAGSVSAKATASLMSFFIGE